MNNKNKHRSFFLDHAGKILSIIFGGLGLIVLVIYLSSSKEGMPSKPLEKQEVSESGKDAENNERETAPEKSMELPKFADTKPVKIVIDDGADGFESEQIFFLGQVNPSDITFDKKEVGEWVTFDINKMENFIVLKNKDKLPEEIASKEFDIVLSKGNEGKHVIFSSKREPKPDFVTWPEREGKTVNQNLDGLSNPLLFKLDGSRVVYGESMSGSAEFSEGLFRQFNLRRVKRKPVCVYNFGNADPVGEMHAIWDLGGRFMLEKDDGTMVRLGSDTAALEPEIMKGGQEELAGLILEVNDAGEELLDKYCEAMSVAPGSLHISLPKKLWFAIYGSVSKKFNDNSSIDVLNTPGKKVCWMLKNHAESYAIIIQEPE